MTDGTRKYRTAIWSPNTSLIAALPQDGPGIDLIDAATASQTRLLTSTYVLDPVWATPADCGSPVNDAACLLIHEAGSGNDRLRSVLISSGAAVFTTLITSDQTMSAATLGGGTVSYSDANSTYIRSLRASTPQTVLNQAMLTLAAAPGTMTMLAAVPQTTNLEGVYTAIWDLQHHITWPLSRIGEGWWLPQWSSDGTRLALTNIDGRIGTTTRDATARYDLGPGESPRWSPDNRFITYTGTSAGDDWTSHDVWIVDWQGVGPRIRLTAAEPAQINVSPSWSPSGREICFVEIDGGKILIGALP
ncbi:MAG: hypothetical protein NVSMB42_15110 [Herpetosiphon sp.]